MREVDFQWKGNRYVAQVDPLREVWQIRPLTPLGVGMLHHQQGHASNTFGLVIHEPSLELLEAAKEALAR